MTHPADADTNEIMDDAADYVGGGRARAESWIEEQLLRAREMTRDEPMKMLAIAAGLGAVIGVVFFRL